MSQISLQEAKNIIRRYYENIKTSSLYLPHDSKFRHFRFNIRDRIFKKVGVTINSKNKLKKVLVEYTPINAYYTVSMFLNPTKLRKKGESFQNNAFLGSDFVLDVDADKTGKMEIKEAVKKNYEILRSLGYKDVSVRFTGRGFHLVIENWFTDSSVESPIEREKICLMKMNEFAEELEKLGVIADFPVSKDTRRIIKLPNTITKYGNLCEIIDINEIDDFRPKTIFKGPVEKPIEQNIRAVLNYIGR